MTRALLIPIGLMVCHSSRAQGADSAWASPRRWSEHHDEITLLTGYHQGRYGSVELGIGRSAYGVVHHPYGVSYYLGAEMCVDRPGPYGVKAGAYVTGGMAMGVQYIHYMEMEGSAAMEVLRPEIGIGLFKFKMTYAYNWRLTKPRIDGVSTHMLSLSYAFRLKRLPRDDTRNGRPRP